MQALSFSQDQFVEQATKFLHNISLAAAEGNISKAHEALLQIWDEKHVKYFLEHHGIIAVRAIALAGNIAGLFTGNVEGWERVTASAEAMAGNVGGWTASRFKLKNKFTHYLDKPKEEMTWQESTQKFMADHSLQVAAWPRLKSAFMIALAGINHHNPNGRNAGWVFIAGMIGELSGIKNQTMWTTGALILTMGGKFMFDGGVDKHSTALQITASFLMVSCFLQAFVDREKIQANDEKAMAERIKKDHTTIIADRESRMSLSAAERLVLESKGLGADLPPM